MQEDTRGNRLQQGCGGSEQRKASVRGMVEVLVKVGSVGKGFVGRMGLPGMAEGTLEVRMVWRV